MTTMTTTTTTEDKFDYSIDYEKNITIFTAMSFLGAISEGQIGVDFKGKFWLTAKGAGELQQAIVDHFIDKDYGYPTVDLSVIKTIHTRQFDYEIAAFFLPLDVVVNCAINSLASIFSTKKETHEFFIDPTDSYYCFVAPNKKCLCWSENNYQLSLLVNYNFLAL